MNIIGKLEPNQTPWRFITPNYNVRNIRGAKHEIIAADGERVCQVYQKNPRVIANGNLLVEAVNNYARLKAIEQERDAWRAALQSLTPGGSEFTTPAECKQYVKTRDADRWELLKKIKVERDALAALLDPK